MKNPNDKFIIFKIIFLILSFVFIFVFYLIIFNLIKNYNYNLNNKIDLFNEKLNIYSKNIENLNEFKKTDNFIISKNNSKKFHNFQLNNTNEINDLILKFIDVSFKIFFNYDQYKSTIIAISNTFNELLIDKLAVDELVVNNTTQQNIINNTNIYNSTSEKSFVISKEIEEQIKTGVQENLKSNLNNIPSESKQSENLKFEGDYIILPKNLVDNSFFINDETNPLNSTGDFFKNSFNNSLRTSAESNKEFKKSVTVEFF